MRVRIFKPSPSVTQSACPCGALWQVEPEAESPRGPEPLMGWTSAEDSLSSLRGRLHFETEEAAIAFARARGWDIAVDSPAQRRVVPKSYVDNFNPDRRRDGR